MDLFDKLVLPMLTYTSQVWGFSRADNQGRLHLKLFKQLIGVRQPTQNNFINGELGRTSLKEYRLSLIIQYWLKLVHYEYIKYNKCV